MTVFRIHHRCTVIRSRSRDHTNLVGHRLRVPLARETAASLDSNRMGPGYFPHSNSILVGDFELNTLVETWTLWHFGTLMLLALLLFVAGALVLPTSAEHGGESLLDNFDRNGRWALLFLFGYSMMGLWANWYLFEISPISYFGGLVLLLGLFPLTYLLVRNRRVQGR